MRAVVRVLADANPSAWVAKRAAWDARSIAQAQNRAPNIVSLFAQRLVVAQQEDDQLEREYEHG